MKATETTIIIPKLKPLSIKVGETVEGDGYRYIINDIDITPNATYIQVGEKWYGSKIFLSRFEKLEN